MYFSTYTYNNEQKIGILSKDKMSMVPLETIFEKLNMHGPKCLNDLIILCDDNMIDIIKKTIGDFNFEGIPINEIKLCAPIPYPRRNIICLGKNYADHAKELKGLTGTDNDLPEHPIYFSKIAYPAIGDGDIIKKHSNITDKIDYEVELAVIIGKDGINIKESDAEEFIFGYTIVNDVSARNVQKKHNQWFKGKSLDTFCPMGPYIVHKSEISFPVDLEIMCKVNDEIRQQSNTNNMIFDIPYIISDLSKGMELKAGDIIITGTPAGVGLGLNPPKFLKSGDKIECYIEKIGYLTNKVE